MNIACGRRAGEFGRWLGCPTRLDLTGHGKSGWIDLILGRAWNRWTRCFRGHRDVTGPGFRRARQCAPHRSRLVEWLLADIDCVGRDGDRR
jgi:hypothetical protein